LCFTVCSRDYKVEVVLKYYVRPEELEEASAIIFGSPTYHHDMTLPMKHILEEAARANVQLQGKIGATFGSYGWSGEAPKLILEVLKNKFGMRTIGSGLAILYTPDNNGLERYKKKDRLLTLTLTSFLQLFVKD